jgi:uncharacterized protein YajQ (UPF0234 family)
MPSFDVESTSDLREVDNAIQNVMREITTRYDFKGSNCSLERKENSITILADDDYKLTAITELLKGHAVRRTLDPRAFDFGKAEKASGNSLRQVVTIKQGVDADNAKAITRGIKDAKMKVQASIQGDTVRITGKKRDDLQEAIAFIKGLNLELPLTFGNFRD